MAASLAPLRHLNDFPSVEQFLQKYYKELTPEEMAKVLKRIEDEVERQYGLRPHVRDLKPMNGVEFVYALNLTRCIGCRKCVHACVAENNQSRNPEIQYIRVVRLPHGSLDLEKAEHNYDPELVPEKGYFYMPVQCQQCKNPPCVKVCPVHATWQEADGITVIDYDWCIGCRYCEAACPYWARHFNFTEAFDSQGAAQPGHGVPGQPSPAPGGDGEMPFLHPAHAGGPLSGVRGSVPGRERASSATSWTRRARLSYILRTKRVFIQLKEELGTSPRFFYYFDV